MLRASHRRVGIDDADPFEGVRGIVRGRPVAEARDEPNDRGGVTRPDGPASR